MAPGLHPPCTPAASCLDPHRCHPNMPSCAKPWKCIQRSRRRNRPLCASAVSILETRAHARCTTCGKYSRMGGYIRRINHRDPRSARRVAAYLKVKAKEMKLKKQDFYNGTHSYEKYVRRHGTKRKKTDCCAGIGHRGRLAPDTCRKCCIL